MDFKDFIKQEETAINTLSNKETELNKNIHQLILKNETIKPDALLVESTRYMKLYDKAVIDEECYRKRSELRGDVYSLNQYNKDIIDKYYDEKKFNITVKADNEIIKNNNIYKKHLRLSNNEQIKTMRSKINAINLLKKEALNNIKYGNYANKYNLQYNYKASYPENITSLINTCNTHRNNYIALQAYNNKYTGISICNDKRSKKYPVCNQTIKFLIDHSFACCGCGSANWKILDVLPYNFGLTDSIAMGSISGSVLDFNPSI